MANTIAENLYSQIDPEGNEYLLLDEITEHRCNADAVTKENMYLDASKRKPRRTTKGWELLVLLKDGTTTWEPLKD
jgi:hypothetical protein